jgi:hypothetical protein
MFDARMGTPAIQYHPHFETATLLEDKQPRGAPTWMLLRGYDVLTRWCQPPRRAPGPFAQGAPFDRVCASIQDGYPETSGRESEAHPCALPVLAPLEPSWSLASCVKVYIFVKICQDFYTLTKQTLKPWEGMLSVSLKTSRSS